MQTKLFHEIQGLSRMTVGELRDKYVEVFGEQSRSFHKDFLRKRIAWRIQALAEGGLSERAKRRAAELANDADLRIRTPRKPIETEPGNTVGPVAQGINTRFGIYNGPYGPDERDIYKPDLVSDLQAPDHYYSDYKAAYNAASYDHPDGEAERRVVAVPIGNCTGTTNGQGSVDILGLGCFFLTQPAEQNGEQRIYGQFVSGCKASGVPGPDPVTGPGPYIIQLYKDPDSVDT